MDEPASHRMSAARTLRLQKVRESSISATALLDRRLRATYAQYKMGIVHVTATWEHVVEREAKRGQITGRRIPPTLLALVYEQVPRAVKQLQRLVDLYVEVNNNGEQPRLRRPEDVLNFMRLCRQLQPAGAAEGRWRKQQRFAIWKYFDPADLND